MLKPTSQTLIWEKKGKPEPEIQNNNTIKIDFSKMSQVHPSTNPFTKCECGALFIQEFIETEGSQMKKKSYQELSQLSYQPSRVDEWKTWVCKFCRRVNRDKDIYIAPNNSKFILDDKIEREILPPILLFIIDYSGSMEESITVELEKNAKKSDTKLTALSEQISKIIEGSQFYKKSSLKEKGFREEYKDYMEMYKKEKLQIGQKVEQKQKKFYSKIAFFMGVIESYMEKISKEHQNEEFRVGFVFFNEAIFLMKPTKQNFIPVITSPAKKKQYAFPFKQSTLSFQSYRQLFEEGQKYDRFFADSRMKKMDMYKLQVENISTEGQTALGPALALSLGIASKHDIGSRIILISDAMPNLGLLSSSDEESNEAVYEEFEKVLKHRKISLGVLNWIDDSIAKQKQGNKKIIKNLEARLKEQFQTFLGRNKEFIKEITIDFSTGYDQVKSLEIARGCVGNLLSRGYMGQALQIQIFKDNDRIGLTKFKYDNIDFRFLKFLNTKSKNWIQFQTSKAKQIDFLFPIITQIVVIYEDVFTKQKYLYMSYVKQKLIKIVNEEEKFEFLENSNISNVKELLDLENIMKFDRQNVIPESICSKASEMKNLEVDKIPNKIYGNIDRTICQSLNQLAEIQNRNLEYDEDEQGYL